MIETPEYAQMMRRMMRAYGRRVALADPEDLADLVSLRDVLDQATTEAVQGLRDRGRSWTDIGRALGISRQSAQQRWGAATDNAARPGAAPRQNA